MTISTFKIITPATANYLEMRWAAIRKFEGCPHSRWHGLAIFLFAIVFCGVALAKKTVPCDCTDVKLEPSKDRLKITRATEVSRMLKALEVSEPAQAALLKEIITKADTFLQHYMNGDMNKMEVPDDWRKKNGWFMGMSMGDWEKLVNRQTDENFTEWNVCPSARLATITRAASTTVIRYEFVTIGRFTMQSKFSTAENGKPFFVEVSLNDQARVIDRKQTPSGANASPYTRVDEFSSICKLKSQGK